MNYAVKDATNVTLKKKLADGSTTPVLYSDYANSTSLEFSADRVFATAKGVNKVAFDTGKSGTFGIELEVFEFKWLSILLGALESESVREISKREVLTVNSGAISLANTPKADSVAIFTVDVDKRSHLEEVEGFTVTGTDVDLSLTSVVDGENVVVYYLSDTATAVKSYTVNDTNYAEAYAIVGDTMLRSEIGTDQFIQLKIPNCRPQGNFSISFSASDVATLSATFDILADENGDMIEFIEIDE